MRTIKALFAAVAVGAISVVLAATAMAANVTLESSAYDPEAGTIDATGYTATTGQMTAVVVEAAKWNAIGERDLTADDLLYLNQFDAQDAEATLTNIGLKGLLTEDVEYYVLLGGDNASEIQVLSITYTEQAEVSQILLADVNGSGDITDSDLVELFAYNADNETYKLKNYDCLDAADVNDSGDITDSDVVELFAYNADNETYKLKYTYTYEKTNHVPVPAE